MKASSLPEQVSKERLPPAEKVAGEGSAKYQGAEGSQSEAFRHLGLAMDSGSPGKGKIVPEFTPIAGFSGHRGGFWGIVFHPCEAGFWFGGVTVGGCGCLVRWQG